MFIFIFIYFYPIPQFQLTIECLSLYLYFRYIHSYFYPLFFFSIPHSLSSVRFNNPNPQLFCFSTLSCLSPKFLLRSSYPNCCSQVFLDLFLFFLVATSCILLISPSGCILIIYIWIIPIFFPPFPLLQPYCF